MQKMVTSNHIIILQRLLGFATLFAVLGAPSLARAQRVQTSAPYDSISAEGVSYSGAGREHAYDLKGPVIRIGIIAPLQGPEKQDGKLIVQAAQMALKDEANHPLPGGLRLELAVGDESGPAWGHAAESIMRLVLDDHAIAVVTSASGSTAHLAEQVCNRIGVPVLTVSTDATTTELNLPWIIRVGPSDDLQAQAIARDIYRRRGLKRVLLVTGSDHDGRVGGRKFTEAVHQLGVSAPDSLVLNPLQLDVSAFVGLLKAKSPQAVVMWVRPENSRTLLEAMEREQIDPAVYLSQEAAQPGADVEFPRPGFETVAKKSQGDAIYSVASAQGATPSARSFAQRYLFAVGSPPSPIAAEAYDAIRLVARAVREAGPNRARVRDEILSVQNVSGVSGTISFDDQGNNRASVRLVRLRKK